MQPCTSPKLKVKSVTVQDLDHGYIITLLSEECAAINSGQKKTAFGTLSTKKMK